MPSNVKKSKPKNKKHKKNRYIKNSGGNEHRLIIISILTVTVIFMILIILFIENRSGSDGSSSIDSIPVNIYYLNAVEGKIEPERHIIKDGSHEEVLKSVLNELRSAAKSTVLSNTIPSDIEIKLSLYENHNLIDVEFSENYKDLSPTDELFCRASLVYTLTELDFIKDVHFYVGNEELLQSNGDPVGILNRGNVKIQSNIPPTAKEIKVLKLYFANTEGLGLVSEEREIQVEASWKIEKCIVEQLIKGTSVQGSVSKIPPETKIIDVSTDDNICYVNLSSDFNNRVDMASSASERLAVYSIVNSLTDLPNVRKVQILIEGKKSDASEGHFDISSPFERDDEIILE